MKKAQRRRMKGLLVLAVGFFAVGFSQGGRVLPDFIQAAELSFVESPNQGAETIAEASVEEGEQGHVTEAQTSSAQSTEERQTSDSSVFLTSEPTESVMEESLSTATDTSAETMETVVSPAVSTEPSAPQTAKAESIQPETTEIVVGFNQTTDTFIASIGPAAARVARTHDLYASVMIAQSILESASGNSSLASPPNYNLFGIKGSYQGQSVSYGTQEDDGSGRLFSILASFRKYPNYEAALTDYAQLLQTSFYAGAHKSQAQNYEAATAYLTGRYATDTRYNQKLNALIKTYDLTQYDDGEKDVNPAEALPLSEQLEDPVAFEVVLSEIQPNHENEITSLISADVKATASSVSSKRKITADTPVMNVSAHQHPYQIGGR